MIIFRLNYHERNPWLNHYIFKLVWVNDLFGKIPWEKLACCLNAPDCHCSNICADLPPWENNRKRGFANEVFNFQWPLLISQLWPVEHSTIEWFQKVQRSNNSMAGMEDSRWWMKLKSDCPINCHKTSFLPPVGSWRRGSESWMCFHCWSSCKSSSALYSRNRSPRLAFPRFVSALWDTSPRQ